MGKISDYTRVLAAKLADVFVVDQTDNGTTETKSATVEQIGTAIGTLQNFADLDTSNKNLVDAINEIASHAFKVIEYTPTTNTVTITASAIGAVCMVFVNRGLPDYDASLEFITGGNANNAPLVGKYRGANLTVSKTSGTEFIITANAEISNSTIYLLAISGEWTISG